MKSVYVSPHAEITNTPVLLFDFDGTLIDSGSLFVKVFRSMGEKYQLGELTDDDIKKLRDKGAREVITSLKIPKWRLPFIMNEGRKKYLSQLGSVSLVQDIKETLQKLQNEYVLGIVTSNDATKVRDFLEKEELSVFSFIYSEKNLFGKGRVIKHVIKKYSLNPSQVIYIGDEVRDIEASQDAGIKIVAVAWGFNSEKALQKHHPDFLARKPQDLLSIMKEAFTEHTDK